MIRIIRKLMRKPALRHNLYVSIIKLLPFTEKRISNKINELNSFFILSTGRSGTSWISNILSNIEGAYVPHEPIPAETYAHLKAVKDQVQAEKYIKVVKRKDIYLRTSRRDCRIYGEINGILRRHLPFLKKYFPKSRYLLLVRDGRKVIRSLLARNTYEGKHPVYGVECPLPSKELSQAWATMTEFEKACWVWKEENENMRKQITNIARLEDITSSYKAFKTQVLEPLDLFLSEDDWGQYANTRANESKKNRQRLDEDWTEEQNKIFDSICGDEMKALGYY